MEKKSYKEKYHKELGSIEWKTKRKQVLEAFDYKCAQCDSRDNLHVHHKSYVFGREAWNYPLSNLIPLCDKCHQLEHNTIHNMDDIFEGMLKSWRDVGLSNHLLADFLCDIRDVLTSYKEKQSLRYDNERVLLYIKDAAKKPYFFNDREKITNIFEEVRNLKIVEFIKDQSLPF